MQLPEWILEISILYHLFVLFCCWYIAICHLFALPLPLLLLSSSSPPLSLCLTPAQSSFSLSFVGLGVIGELDSYFFSHHALILSHAAWLTGSWSARTELLITGNPPPHPPSASATHTHTHTQTHKAPSLYGCCKCKAFFFFFSFERFDFCRLIKTLKETRQGGILPYYTLSFFLFLHILQRHTCM